MINERLWSCALLDRLPNESSAWHESEEEVVAGLAAGAVRAAQWAVVCEAIESLPNWLEREAVRLRFMEGKTYREIGEIQKCTEEGARQRVFRVVGTLRELVL